MRIVIAEDSALLRAGIARLLADEGHELVALVEDAPSLVAAVERHRPDIAIVDVRLPPGYSDEGLRGALEVQARVPCALLVLSHYVEERYAAELLENSTHGVGYLLKDRVADVAEFMKALEEVAAGQTVLDREVVAQLITRRRREVQLERLTGREHEVLRRMAEGRTNSAIAEELGISDGAVEKHVSNIFGKLGLEATDTNHRRVLAVLAYLRS